MSNMNSKLFQCMLPHYFKWKNSSFGHPYFDAMSVWMFPIIRGPPRRYYKWSIPPNCGNLYIGHNKPFAIHHCWMSVEPCNPEENAWHCMEAGWGLRSRVCSNLGPLTCQNTTRTGLQRPHPACGAAFRFVGVQSWWNVSAFLGPPHRRCHTLEKISLSYLPACSLGGTYRSKRMFSQ